MINNELEQVNVYSYSQVTDDYGQLRQDGAKKKRVVEMYVRPYSIANTNDTRYVDIELIGLTKDNSIKDSEIVEINKQEYAVMYLIPSRRWNQVLMRKYNG